MSMRIIVSCRMGISILILINIGISVIVGAIANLVLAILSTIRLQLSFELAFAFARDSNCQICSRLS